MLAAPLVFFSHVMDRGAKVVAAAPRLCLSRRRTTLLICSEKE
jgi:hypothetical protein